MFWTIFWIAIFIIPAFWLANLVLRIALGILGIIISGIIMAVGYIWNKLIRKEN